jgi:hypothetical protein
VRISKRKSCPFVLSSKTLLTLFLFLISTRFLSSAIFAPYLCDGLPLRKYRYMDSNLTQRRRGLEEKIPDIKKTLSMVEFLRDRRVRPTVTLSPFVNFTRCMF